MVNLPAVLIANGTAVLLLCVILASRRGTVRTGLPDERLFLAITFMTLLLCSSETISFLVDGRADFCSYFLARLTNSLDFTLNIVLTYTWTLYVDYKYYEDTARLKRIGPWLALPALAVVAGAVASIFFPVYFSFTDNNVYAREPLHIVPFLLSYLYLVYGVVIALRAQHRARQKRYLFMPILFFMFPVALASALQFAFYGISLLWLGVTVGLVSLYLNLQNQTNYIDRLSGVYNRQYLDRYLGAWLAGGRQRETLVGYMLDIDGFKVINDRAGHLAGDRTITDVGAALRGVTGQHGFAARYGGDEFVLVKRFTPEEISAGEPEAYLGTLAVLTLPPQGGLAVHLSVGYAVAGAADSYDSFVGRMDEAMYAAKQAYRRSRETPAAPDA